jgi:hypothetical protein
MKKTFFPQIKWSEVNKNRNKKREKQGVHIQKRPFYLEDWGKGVDWCV